LERVTRGYEGPPVIASTRRSCSSDGLGIYILSPARNFQQNFQWSSWKEYVMGFVSIMWGGIT